MEAREAEGTTPGSVAAYVAVLAVIALVVLAAAGVELSRLGRDALVDPELAVGAALFVGGLLLFQSLGFEFEWRGHRLTGNLDEAVVFAALLYLPAGLVAPAVALTGIAAHVRRGRPVVKGVFNVAHDVVAAGAAWGTFEILRVAGAPDVVAAAPTPVAFVLVSNVLLAGVFARLERVGTVQVFRERFVSLTAFQAVIGVAGGIAIVALLRLHPIALGALLPFAYALKRNTVLASQADRELAVHRRLAEVALELAGTSNVDAVAERVILTCGEILPAGRVSLRLEPAGPAEAVRYWSRDFERGPAPDRPPITVDLPGRGGVLGIMSVYPVLAGRPFGEIDEAVARIVAAQAAGAFANAEALATTPR